MNLVNEIHKIFIHEESLHSPVAQRAIELWPDSAIEVVSERPHKNLEGELSAQEFDQSKKQIYICEHKGHFFKRCPGARPGLTCCNYFVLNLGLQCNMNCSYCYLQSFINTPVMTIYSNIDKALSELKEMAPSLKDQKLRVGTGETIDSLSLDELTLYSKDLIDFFKDYPNWQLEFKTKSDKVDHFVKTPHSGNVVVSWSVNPQNIISAEEHGTASLQERLKAARKCVDHGFQVAFHMDPMIWHPQWEKSYEELVLTIADQFKPADLPYLSLGALRFQPEQKSMMRERFGMKSWVTQAETFQSKDGKMRYDQALRKEMFDFVIKKFKALDSRWNIFLCMETPETWLQTYETMPKKDPGLEKLFDHNVIRKFRSHSARVEQHPDQ